MRSLIRIVCWFSGLVVCSGIVFSQSGGINKVATTSFQFLKVIPDARSTAMGGAYTAAAANSDAVFSNPAALAKLEKSDIALSHVDWLLDMSQQSFSLAYVFDGAGTIGLFGMIVDMGTIDETRVDYLVRDELTGAYNPGLTGAILSPGAQVFGLSYAKYITDKFAFGLTTKYVREDLVVSEASATIFDAGFSYRTGFKSLELAAAVKHFGPEIKFREAGESYPLPQDFSIGISAYVVGPDQAFVQTNSKNKLLLAFDMVEARDYGQQYNLGLEYSINDMFFIRAGEKINYDTESFSLGFGMDVKNLRVDYSYASFGESFAPVSRFSIGFGKN